MPDDIVLVDLFDREIGSCDKERAHLEGKLHRAFSVFLYGERGLLLQRRAEEKYHSGGLWANTCCSHPRAGESTPQAARRRLQEETGIACEISERFSFVYYHPFANDLYEYELDHVYMGGYDGEADFDPAEIAEMRWVTPSALHQELLDTPERFTSWFLIAAPRVLALLEQEGFK